MIKINVGGTQYRTTLGTLRKAAFFEALLRNSGETGISEEPMQRVEDEDGNLFIDRNGIAFYDILEFLRTGQPVAPSVDASVLIVEADYYGIEGFEVLQETLPAKKLFLPAERVRRELIQAVGTERFHHRTHMLFDIEALPAYIREFTHLGNRGIPGCLYQQDLTDLGFSMRPTAAAASAEENAEEYPSFERTVRTVWIDLEQYEVDESMWNRVEIVVPGRVAKAVAYE